MELRLDEPECERSHRALQGFHSIVPLALMLIGLYSLRQTRAQKYDAPDGGQLSQLNARAKAAILRAYRGQALRQLQRLRALRDYSKEGEAVWFSFTAGGGDPTPKSSGIQRGGHP
ncbi:TPA: hypothetical protein ACH3X2_004033 [Trebouxia sp. C0005]